MVPAMKRQRTLAEWWLWLGVAAIAVAGLYALVPVISRTPQLQALEVVQQFFGVALVVHVDLSVLIWSLAMLGMGIALLMQPYQDRWPGWGKAGFGCVAAATVLMAFSPLDPHWDVVKSNYIPVLQNILFFLSLGLLSAGMLITLIPVTITYACPNRWHQLDAISCGWVTAGVIVLLALLGHFLSANAIPAGLPADAHYEQLFWAGGHIMQFSFVVIAMVAWLSLATALGTRLPQRRWVLLAYMLAALGALLSFAGFILPFDSAQFVTHQTRVMIELGGLSATLLAVLLIPNLCRTPRNPANRAYLACLIMSLILFFAGGGLGLMIAGQNVTIPAHYHGMIVGITLALMGLAYTMLPKFGYKSVADTKLAFWQPLVYGIGQLMHIGGLAYCGGYGILRKTPGGFEHLAPDIKIALGIFGVGGIIAIIGGLMFVVVMGCVRSQSSASHHP